MIIIAIMYNNNIVPIALAKQSNANYSAWKHLGPLIAGRSEKHGVRKSL